MLVARWLEIPRRRLRSDRHAAKLHNQSPLTQRNIWGASRSSANFWDSQPCDNRPYHQIRSTRNTFEMSPATLVT